MSLHAGASAPQGLDAITAALAIGGQPTGQISNLPSPVGLAGVSAGLPPQQVPGAPAGPLPATGNPIQGALADANPDQIELIIQAVLSGLLGGNNSEVPVG